MNTSEKKCSTARIEVVWANGDRLSYGIETNRVPTSFHLITASFSRMPRLISLTIGIIVISDD